MWNPSSILVIPAFPTQRDSAGNVIAYAAGFFMLVDPSLMADDLKPYLIQSAAPVEWSGGNSLYLGFPDEATAKGTSLGAQWTDATTMPAAWTIPKSVAPRQLKLALLAAGKLDAIEAFVASQTRDVQISWNDTIIFERTNPMLKQMATAFGMTDADVDAIFKAAISL